MQNSVSQGGLIQSSCRKISVPEKLHSSVPDRIELLNRLMDSPIDWVFNDMQSNTIDTVCLRGKKLLVVNFWATWCAPCIEELSSLSKLAENNNDAVFVTAVSTEDPETITKFLNRAFSDLSPHLKFAQVDQKNKSQYFPEDSLPVTYIFDKKGFLKVKELGARDWSNSNIVRQIRNF